MFTTRGGGSKAVWTMFKKTDDLVLRDVPYTYFIFCMELWCNIEQHQQVQHVIGDYWARDKHYYSSFDLATSTLPQSLTWHPCEIHLETRGNSCKLTGNWSMAEQSRAVGGWSWSRRWKPGSTKQHRHSLQRQRLPTAHESSKQTFCPSSSAL